jgi:hypothetical protein
MDSSLTGDIHLSKKQVNSQKGRFKGALGEKANSPVENASAKARLCQARIEIQAITLFLHENPWERRHPCLLFYFWLSVEFKKWSEIFEERKS